MQMPLLVGHLDCLQLSSFMANVLLMYGQRLILARRKRKMRVYAHMAVMSLHETHLQRNGEHQPCLERSCTEKRQP